MNVLQKSKRKFPFDWVNIEYLPDSKAHRMEIYLKETNNPIVDLTAMFYSLFGNLKENIIIYDSSWWDFCLDTWDVDNNTFNYSIEGKSDETKKYIRMLEGSEIEIGYSGLCTCNDWDTFLYASLNCIIIHQAPYSPLFFNAENNFFFYFHHTGSIGFYYKMENEIINKIVSIAKIEYDIKQMGH